MLLFLVLCFPQQTGKTEEQKMILYGKVSSKEEKSSAYGSYLKIILKDVVTNGEHKTEGKIMIYLLPDQESDGGVKHFYKSLLRAYIQIRKLMQPCFFNLSFF